MYEVSGLLIPVLCNSRKYPCLPMEGIFFPRPPSPPLWKFQLSFIHFFKVFDLTEPPSCQEILIPSVGGGGRGVWIFSGIAHCYEIKNMGLKKGNKSSQSFCLYLWFPRREFIEGWWSVSFQYNNSWFTVFFCCMNLNLVIICFQSFFQASWSSSRDSKVRIGFR